MSLEEAGDVQALYQDSYHNLNPRLLNSGWHASMEGATWLTARGLRYACSSWTQLAAR